MGSARVPVMSNVRFGSGGGGGGGGGEEVRGEERREGE